MSEKPTYEELEQKVRALEGCEERLSLANQKLETLHSIISLKGADIQTISNHVLNSICKMTQSRYGFYGFLDDDASDMTIHAWTDAALKDCSVKDRPKHFPIKRAGVWAEAIRNKKAYILNDYESYQGKKGAPDGHVKINNLLVLPILKDSSIISVAAVANKPSKYDQDDITQLETFLFGIQALVESKQAEEKARESEKKLVNFVNNLPGTAYQFAIDESGTFRFEYMGENCIDLFGFSADEIIADANNVFSLIPQSDAHDVQEAIKKSAASLTPYNVEHRVVKNNGDTVWVRASSIPRKLDNGNIIWDGIGLNITEKKQIEEELKAERFKLHEYFENLPMLAYNVSFDGIIEDINSFALKALGYTEKSEIIGKPLISTVYAPESRNKAKRLIEKWKEEKVLKNEELRIITKRGKRIDVLLNADTIFDHNGTPMHSLSTHLDIGDRKQIEKALKESEEKYRSMMESLDEATYICSSDYRIEYMNPAMIRKIGRDATGERCYKVLHGLDEQCPWCEHDKVMKGKSIKTELVKPKEDEAYLISHSPIFHTNGSVSKLSIYRDITETRKLEYRIQQAQKMESLGNLAGGIAHDFNNILSSIIGFTELALDETQKGTTIEDSLQEVYAAGKRAKDLVKQILAFARQSDENIAPISPSKTAKEVLHFMRSTLPTTIEIQQEIESESLIMGNATQVHQVLMNLCTNAAHVMEDSGGILKVSIKDVVLYNELEPGMRPGNYVEIKVSDTGVGIAPEIRDSIFDPYFTTKEPGEGTGMGLAMVQGIIESYGGKITVASQLRKGATFTIYLPVTKKRSAQDAYIPEELPTGTERILFIDDEAPIAKMGSQILERLGYSVTSRTNSIEALELFQAKPDDFDLVITDMTMPNLTGDKLAIELMKIRPDISVILCTGYSRKISDEAASEIGIKAFAYKPVVKADLAKTVRKVLDGAIEIEN